MIGKNKGLHNYVKRGGALSYLTLNMWIAIAVVPLWFNLHVAFGILVWPIFMSLLASVYYILLGRTGIIFGVLLYAVAHFSVRWAVIADSVAWFPFVIAFAILISIGAWVYANMIFSRYKKIARQRISQIEKESFSSTDEILEKGILLQAVLGQKSASLEALEHSLSMEGGEALLWYLGAIVLGRMKRYSEELKALDRAVTASPDEKLTKQIEKLNKSVQKRL